MFSAKSDTSFKTRLRRALALSTRSRLTQDEISLQRDNLARAQLLVNIRWMLIGTYAVFAVAGVLIFLTGETLQTVVKLLIVPAVAAAIAVVYNMAFARFSSRFANLAVLNLVQLVLDVGVAAVLIYFSGGVESWFWIVMILFIFEAALVAPRSNDVWYLTAFICVLLSALEWLEFMRILPHQQIPWSPGVGWDDWRYVLIFQAWQLTAIIGSAWIASTLIVRLREMLDKSRLLAIIDEQTGLGSKTFFDRVVEIEVQRAASDGRPAFIGFIDIDHLGLVNTMFGISKGDLLLTEVARAIDQEMKTFNSDYASANVLARISGDEFAFLVVDNMNHEEGQVTDDDVSNLAKRMVKRVEALNVEGISTTISVGYAYYPVDALDPDGVWLRADEALAYASGQGGNQVARASDVPYGHVVATFSPYLYEDE